MVRSRPAGTRTSTTWERRRPCPRPRHVPEGRSASPARARMSSLRRPSRKMAICLAVIVALALVAILPRPLKKTPRNMVGISYGGGPFESAHFQRIVQPGSSLFFNGFFDPLYLYPADTQNYIVSKTVGQGAVTQPDSIISPSKDRVQIEYQIAVYFRLNIDRLRAFHESLGLQYSAYTAERLEEAHHRHVPSADRERPAGGDPEVRRRRPLRQRRRPHHDPGLGPTEAERPPGRIPRPAVLLRPDLRAGSRLRRTDVQHQEDRHPAGRGEGLPGQPDVADPGADQRRTRSRNGRPRRRPSKRSTPDCPRRACPTCSSERSSPATSASGCCRPTRA